MRVLGPNSSTGVEPPPRDERCIVCVDDDPEFLKSLEYVLPQQINGGGAPCSYRFLFVNDPVEALEVLRELVADGETVAMVLSDHQMPHMKGTEFLARSRELVPASVRVLLTGHAGIDAAITAINERLLDRFLTKPIESEQDFVLSVRHLLDRFEMQRQLEEQGDLIRGLYEFANTLNAAQDLDSTLRLAVEFTRAALGCDDIRVILIPAAAGGAAAETSSPATAPERRATPVEPPRLGPPLESGIVGRIEDCPWYDVVAAETGDAWPQGAVAYAALRGVDRDLGLILAWEPENGRGLTDASLAALRHVAASTAVAVQNQLGRARLEEIGETRARHLEEARGRLAILDRLKSDFLSFVSHELRTPLNYISAIGMIDGDLDRAEHEQMVGIVRDGYARLERFIVSSLEYFQWCAATPDTSEEETDVAALVRAVAGTIGSPGAAADVEVSVPDERCMALFPARCAETVLRILVDNAVKFSNGRPHIRLEVAAGPDRVTLAVADHGRGFPPEWATEIFRPFTIADSLHHGEGTALSLAKAAAMVATYGGHIHARSPGAHRGATFTVELPVRNEGTAKVVELGRWTGLRIDGDAEPEVGLGASKAA